MLSISFKDASHLVNRILVLMAWYVSTIYSNWTERKTKCLLPLIAQKFYILFLWTQVQIASTVVHTILLYYTKGESRICIVYLSAFNSVIWGCCLLFPVIYHCFSQENSDHFDMVTDLFMCTSFLNQMSWNNFNYLLCLCP